MRLIFLASASLIALGGLALSSFDMTTKEPTTRSAPYTPVPNLKTAQASSKCLTSGGICFVQPLPVGSPCTCGDFAGVIVP